MPVELQRQRDEIAVVLASMDAQHRNVYLAVSDAMREQRARATAKAEQRLEAIAQQARISASQHQSCSSDSDITLRQPHHNTGRCSPVVTPPPVVAPANIAIVPPPAAPPAAAAGPTTTNSHNAGGRLLQQPEVSAPGNLSSFSSSIPETRSAGSATTTTTNVTRATADEPGEADLPSLFGLLANLPSNRSLTEARIPYPQQQQQQQLQLPPRRRLADDANQPSAATPPLAVGLQPFSGGSGGGLCSFSNVEPPAAVFVGIPLYSSPATSTTQRLDSDDDEDEENAEANGNGNGNAAAPGPSVDDAFSPHAPPRSCGDSWQLNPRQQQQQHGGDGSGAGRPLEDVASASAPLTKQELMATLARAYAPLHGSVDAPPGMRHERFDGVWASKALHPHPPHPEMPTSSGHQQHSTPQPAAARSGAWWHSPQQATSRAPPSHPPNDQLTIAAAAEAGTAAGAPHRRISGGALLPQRTVSGGARGGEINETSGTSIFGPPHTLGSPFGPTHSLIGLQSSRDSSINSPKCDRAGGGGDGTDRNMGEGTWRTGTQSPPAPPPRRSAAVDDENDDAGDDQVESDPTCSKHELLERLRQFYM